MVYHGIILQFFWMFWVCRRVNLKPDQVTECTSSANDPPANGPPPLQVLSATKSRRATCTGGRLPSKIYRWEKSLSGCQASFRMELHCSFGWSILKLFEPSSCDQHRTTKRSQSKSLRDHHPVMWRAFLQMFEELEEFLAKFVGNLGRSWEEPKTIGFIMVYPWNWVVLDPWFSCKLSYIRYGKHCPYMSSVFQCSEKHHPNPFRNKKHLHRLKSPVWFHMIAHKIQLYYRKTYEK